MLKTTFKTSSVFTAVDTIMDNEPNKSDPNIQAATIYKIPRKLTDRPDRRGEVSRRTMKAIASP
jgi:hypothetical protein